MDTDLESDVVLCKTDWRNKLMSAKLNLPKVVLEVGDYRFVAVAATMQKESIHHQKWIVDISEDETPSCIELVAEKKSTDSLGNEQWAVVEITDARHAVLRQLLVDGVNQKVTKTIGKTTRSSKSEDKE